MMDNIKISKDLCLDSDFGTVFWDLYEPSCNNPQYIIQIAHGMLEHKGRYTWVAHSLAQAGFIVAINDHRGHGKSINIHDNDRSSEEIFWGEMGQDGLNAAAKDLLNLNEKLHNLYPKSHIILLGHSMGSLIARLYLFTYAYSIQALILSGTPAPNACIDIAIFLAYILKVSNFKNGAKILHKLSLENFNNALLKKLNIKQTQNNNLEWLCQDKEVLEKYASDDACNFIFSSQSFLNLFKAMKKVYAKSQYADFHNKDIPILFISGNMDACGCFGDGVQKAKQILQEQGFENVSMKLYENLRHEVLNEYGKEIVLNDVIEFVKSLNIK